MRKQCVLIAVDEHNEKQRDAVAQYMLERASHLLLGQWILHERKYTYMVMYGDDYIVLHNMMAEGLLLNYTIGTVGASEMYDMLGTQNAFEERRG